MGPTGESSPHLINDWHREHVRRSSKTRYAKSRDEVLYNPVLQTFTDRSRETGAKQREATQRVGQLNVARDRQIARESQFDILNMRDKRGGLGSQAADAARAAAAAATLQSQPPPRHSERPTFHHPLDSCYQFNIVSNLPLSQHHYTAPELRPNVDAREEPKPRLQTTTNLPRDFDVLSGRYRSGHDEKVARDPRPATPCRQPRAGNPVPATPSAQPATPYN